jgi:hypothetical protein
MDDQAPSDTSTAMDHQTLIDSHNWTLPQPNADGIYFSAVSRILSAANVTFQTCPLCKKFDHRVIPMKAKALDRRGCVYQRVRIMC